MGKLELILFVGLKKMPSSSSSLYYLVHQRSIVNLDILEEDEGMVFPSPPTTQPGFMINTNPNNAPVFVFSHDLIYSPFIVRHKIVLTKNLKSIQNIMLLYASVMKNSQFTCGIFPPFSGTSYNVVVAFRTIHRTTLAQSWCMFRKAWRVVD